MGKLTAPDKWAADNGAKRENRAWHYRVPAEVTELVRQSGDVTVADLMNWFKTVVAEAYPDESWPSQASISKVEDYKRALRENS